MKSDRADARNYSINFHINRTEMYITEINNHIEQNRIVLRQNYKSAAIDDIKSLLRDVTDNFGNVCYIDKYLISK